MKRAVFFCCILLLAVSCMRNRGLVRSMNDIETYVHDAPDSALSVLSSLDTAGVSSNLVDARYTLLNSIARYRLYIDEDDDSSLSRAAEFFRKHHDNERLMKALFLAGYIQFNHADYKQSILTLTKGESFADVLGNHFYGGLICRQLALCFERAFNNTDRLRSIQAAYDHFIAGEYESHANYALLMLGEAYTANGLYHESDSVFKEVIALGKQTGNSRFLGRSLLSYAEDLVVRDEPQPARALKLFTYAQDSLHYPVSCYSLATAALSAALLKDGQTSDAYFELADKQAKTEYEKYLISFRKYEAALELNRSSEALDAAKKAFRYLIDTGLKLERDSSVDVQRDYYHEIGENARLRLSLTRQRLLSALLFITLVCICLFWIIRMLFIKGRLLQRENQALSSQVLEMEQSSTTKLKLALESGMRFFNKLAEFKWINRPEKILPSFEIMLNNLATDKDTIEEMMATLNATHNNLMTRLAEQVPTLKKDDLMVYSYLAHQFDHMTLCTILDRTPGALNSKIYRIREKITQSSAKDTEEFLGVIRN